MAYHVVVRSKFKSQYAIDLVIFADSIMIAILLVLGSDFRIRQRSNPDISGGSDQAPEATEADFEERLVKDGVRKSLQERQKAIGWANIKRLS